MVRTRLFAAIAVLGFMLAPASAMAELIFGYVARGDVRVPGQMTETWVVTGVVRGVDYGSCERAAEANATQRLMRKGSIVAGPAVKLCTPLVGNTEHKEK